MRVQLILNPQADQGRVGQQLPKIRALVGDEIEILLTERAGHGQELAEAAVVAGVDCVIAGGGDGTVHEVVNGLMRAYERAGVAAEARKTALGILPLGTGNDLAYALGLPANKPELVLPRILKGKRRGLDVGHIKTDKVGDCYFANGVGIGMDALVAIEASQIRYLTDFVLYVVAAVRVIMRRLWRWPVKVWWDGEFVEQDMVMLAIGNGPRAGGGFLLTPQAEVADGVLGTCLVTPMSRPWVVYMLLKTLRGAHVGSSLVKMGQKAEIRIEAETGLPIHLDGEILSTLADDVRQVTIRCVANGLEVIL
ncbi:MAG TPA: diacylglycerol kinase family protein [Anaerolineae bacterium]|nr:diacylglycerol kinase family protein [Anaerolineae bacterium]